MQKRPKRFQKYPWTSGTAELLGKAIDQSPIHAEKLVKDTLGGVAPQLLNLSDKALNYLGIIDKKEAGGRSTVDAVTDRFVRPRGGRIRRKKKEDMIRRRDNYGS